MQPEWVADIAAGGAKEAAVIARPDAVDPDRFQLTLSLPDIMEREGELRLALNSLDRRGGVIACIAVTVFTVNQKNAEWVIEVGCIQGCSQADGALLTKAATKGLCRIRPKNLLMHALYVIAEHWQIKKILCISDAAHVYRKQPAKAHAIHFSYDTFWEEQHGKRISPYWFELPTRRVMRDIHDVPSHHRSEFRKRQVIEASLLTQIKDRLPSPFRPS